MEKWYNYDFVLWFCSRDGFWGVLGNLFLLLLAEELACGFDEGVTPTECFAGVEGYDGVGGYAELDLLMLGIGKDHGTVAHCPSVGYFLRERHPGASARGVAEYGDEGKFVHGGGEVVGGTEYAAIGEQYGGFLPAHAIAGLDVEGFVVGEVVASFSCLVAHVAHEGFLVGESGG